MTTAAAARETAVRLAIAAAALLAVPAPFDQRADGGVAVGAGVVVGAALVRVLAGAWPPVVPALRNRRRSLIVKAPYLTTAAATEEVVWRHLVFGGVAAVAGAGAAFAVSTTGFALAHRRRLPWRAVAQHAITGACFGALLVATGTVLAAVAAHVAYNLGLLVGAESDRVAAPRASPEPAR